ncbi:alpha-2Da adrenergic receptor-like isoform X2 [Artemia franciscana]
MGCWIFGEVWCEIHGAIDVLLSTASIMNLCMISLDRYWSVTRAIEYLRKRTRNRATIMITIVWLLSAIISIPPLLGWKVEQKENECTLSTDKWYVLYSALGSFYIPSCIMVFVYLRIYMATRARAKRALERLARRKSTQRKTVEQITIQTKSCVGTVNLSKDDRSDDSECALVNHVKTLEILGNQPPVKVMERVDEIEANQYMTVNQTRKNNSELCNGNNEAEINYCSPMIQSEKGSPEQKSDCLSSSRESKNLRSASDDSTSKFCSLNDSDSVTEYKTAQDGFPSEEHINQLRGGTILSYMETLNPPSQWNSCTNEEVVLTVLTTVKEAIQQKKDDSTALDQNIIDFEAISELESCDSVLNTKCGVTSVKPLRLRLTRKMSGSRRPSKLKRQVIDLGNPLATRDPAREKRRVARKREQRATLILGLIMGAFILCWLPFFVLYVITPFCEESLVDPKGFAVAFWLGYCNSALNPVIYTIFNKDFRKALRKILLLNLNKR